MKVLYVLAMARFLEVWQENGRITELAVPFILTGVPFTMIILQPDLGTAVIFLPVMFIMIFIAGIRMKYILAMALIFIVLCPLTIIASNISQKYLGKGIISDYQKERVAAFLNPEKEKLGVSYQSCQSLEAIGSGKIMGRGIGNGTKTQLDLLPEKHTDFIVTVIAEEGGFIAILILLSAFYIFLFSAFLTAHNAPDTLGRLTVVGIIAIISTQIIINISVAVSLLPITGITLPFISYGGSSLVSSFFAIGVVMNVGKEKKPYFT
jgi:rod shape determining protein RodA